MKTYALMKGRRAQILVTVIIVLAIVLALGVAVLFHSRSFREVTRVQVDTDKAYSLAKSGIGIGELYIEKYPLIENWEETYKLGPATVKVEINQEEKIDYGKYYVYTGGTITSTGRTGRSVRVVERPYSLYRPVSAKMLGPIGWVEVYVRYMGCTRRRARLSGVTGKTWSGGQCGWYGGDYGDATETVLHPKNPFNPGAWTWDDIRDMDIVLELARFSGSEGRVTQLLVRVYSPEGALLVTLGPNGKGFYTNIEGPPYPESHWVLVDDLVPDGDETYVYSNTSKDDWDGVYSADAYKIEDPPYLD